MTENLKKFLEAVSKDEALQAKVNALESNKETAMADIIALAKELGIELTEADFAQPDGEISEDELETINGGGCPTNGTVNNSCCCAAAGGGYGKQKDKDIWGCACVAYGQGGDGKEDHTTCMCVLYGHGEG